MKLPLVLSLLWISGLGSLATAANGRPPSVDFRWSSTGGGWRSLFGCVGFANVFQQAGLFSEDASIFSSISTTSGATWFSTQLFYSSAFYNQTVMAESPSDLYDFVVTWMEAYYDITIDMEEVDMSQIMEANMTDLSAGNEDSASLLTAILELFGLILTFDGDWAYFVQEMLEAGAQAYGHEGNLSDIVAIPENRLTPLQNTDLVVQAGLVPNSRIRVASNKRGRDLLRVDDIANFISAALEEDKDMVVYLGPPPPSTSEDAWLYTVAFSAAYIVNSTWNGFYYGTLDSTSHGQDLMTYMAPTPMDHEFEDWDDFHLWPFDASEETMAKVPKRIIIGREDGQDTILGKQSSNTSDSGMMMETGAMPRPFGGNAPTIIQLAAISSAVAGGFSPSVPSLFSQALSKQRENVGEARGFLALQAFDVAVRKIYESFVLDNAAVCSQWPHGKCEGNEGRFVDGVYVDNPAVVVNIAQYQKSANADRNVTIKLVLTNTNEDFNSTRQRSQILQYFQTEFNQDVPPGGFVWLPGVWAPTRSAQVFGDFLTAEQLDALAEPLEDSRMSTAILQGTTIDNPSFGVKAGQPVEILLINLNEEITTFVAAPSIIREQTIPLAEMTRAIATNQELVQRVKDFFFGENGDDSPTAFAEVTRSGTTNLQLQEDTQAEPEEEEAAATPLSGASYLSAARGLIIGGAALLATL